MSKNEIAKSETVNKLIAAIRTIANEDDEKAQTEAALQLLDIFAGKDVSVPSKPFVAQLPGDSL